VGEGEDQRALVEVVGVVDVASSLHKLTIALAVARLLDPKHCIRHRRGQISESRSMASVVCVCGHVIIMWRVREEHSKSSSGKSSS
jgi:hypothetical protein